MAFFFHPDFTVGPGVSPSQPEQAFMISLTPGSGSRTLPPVGNFTRPRRIFLRTRFTVPFFTIPRIPQALSNVNLETSSAC